MSYPDANIDSNLNLLMLECDLRFVKLKISTKTADCRRTEVKRRESGVVDQQLKRMVKTQHHSEGNGKGHKGVELQGQNYYEIQCV
jgi:hypothetical protein